MHLGSKYIQNGKEIEYKLCDWLESIKSDAKALYMLGDVLDYWYEYKYVIPKGHIRFFGKLAELADSGIKIYWFIGNHDIWLFNYFQKELGITVIDGFKIEIIEGKRFFLAHGDGVGYRSLAFKFMRALFRNKFCQFLYSAIHPRWTIPFALSWSSHSRKIGNMDSDSNYEAQTAKALEGLRSFAVNYNATHKAMPINYFVFGHLHTLVNEKLNKDTHLIVLGDWIKLFSFARFDGEIMEVSSLSK